MSEEGAEDLEQPRRACGGLRRLPRRLCWPSNPRGRGRTCTRPFRGAAAATRSGSFFTPANANTARHDTSQPGELDPAPQKTSMVFAGPLSSGGAGASAARASQAKRVALPGVVFEVLGEHHGVVGAAPPAAGRSRPACRRDRRPPRARRRPSTLPAPAARAPAGVPQASADTGRAPAGEKAPS